MIIQLEKPVYEKIWTGEVDQILSYDTDKKEFTVRSIRSGKERTHKTALDCCKLSFAPNPNFNKQNYECIKYVIKKGIYHLSRIPSKFYELIHDTSSKLDEMIRLLQKINNGEVEVESTIDCGHKLIIIKDEPILNRIHSLACDILIAPGGQCNWDNIDKVKKAGFDVFPGDKDGFGWLTGCIQTNKGIIIFG